MNSEQKNLYDHLTDYSKRMYHIRSLSSPKLGETATADAYSAVLRDNFKEIGKLAEKNRRLISECIIPILDSTTPLDDEVVHYLYTGAGCLIWNLI